MKKCFFCLPIAALAAFAFAMASPLANEPRFSITLSAPQTVFKAGSEVKIRLVFKNISSGEVPYGRTLGIGVEPHGEFLNDVEVRDAKGDSMPKTDYYRALRGDREAAARLAGALNSGKPSGPVHVVIGFNYSMTAYMLKPGESREEDIVVSKLFDLSKPGQYTVTASRRLLDYDNDPRSKIIAKSNALTITIVK
ncbi:MAG TPA: hypothetical protein VME43_14020 [Bryobacteraceae bacterium]|nr:hypothetical protein [Bryobacteraceae bacterium]